MVRRRYGGLVACLVLAACVAPATLDAPLPHATGLFARYPLQAVGALEVVAASADSQQSGFAPANAVDGKLGTAWVSGAPAATTGWLVAALAADASVTSVLVATGPLPLGQVYDVQVSRDGASWTTLLRGLTNTTPGLEAKPFPAPVTARYLRLFWHNQTRFRPQPFRVSELQIQGGPLATPTPLPSAVPVSVGQGAAPAGGGATGTPARPAAITLQPLRTLHRADSHVLGMVRNHVSDDFPNGPAKLARLAELAPTWGERRLLYRIGHGITDGRLDYSYMPGFHFEDVWDQPGPYPYDDLRYAIAEANTIGADALHVVNFGTGTPEEAARYVSYLNHAGDANQLEHPCSRATAHYFEIGNEMAWHMERGHQAYAPNEIAYARRARLFARAMRAASDVPIQIGAVASINSNWLGDGWSGGATTVKNILQTMGPDVDFLVFHGYPSWPVVKSGNLLSVLAQNEWTRQKLESEIKPAIARYANGRDVYLANTEFFTNLYGDAPHSQGLFGALFTADSIALAMNEDIRMATEFCLSHGTMADSAYFYADDPNRPTPLYEVQQLLAQHWGDTIVGVTSAGVPTKVVVGAATTVTMPDLALAGATSADGHSAYLLVVNRTNDTPVSALLDPGFRPMAVTAYTLSGAQGWDSATAGVTARFAPALAPYVFAPATVTVLQFAR